MKALSRYSLLLLLTLFAMSCLKEEALKKEFSSLTPKDIGDGLLISTAEAENVDVAQLQQLYREVHADNNLWQIRSLLVFRNDKIIAESYMKDDADIQKKAAIWSCTKQVLGIMVGLAVDNGSIASIDDPISKYIPDVANTHPDKAEISIRNLITMQSGIGYSNDGLEGQTDDLLRELPDHITKFILDLPMREPQGSSFSYNDGDPHLIASMLQTIVGRPLDEWANEHFFHKIGVHNLEWRRYKDGTTLGGYGILTTPRELAKIAMVAANNGRYKNEELLSEEWAHAMTSTQVEFLDASYQFGYYWWIDPQRKIKFMWGHGGQFAFIIPEKNMMVMITSEPNTQGKHQIDADEALEIVDRIIETAI